MGTQLQICPHDVGMDPRPDRAPHLRRHHRVKGQIK